MDSVNVQIYKIDIGKLIFVKKKYWLGNANPDSNKHDWIVFTSEIK
jgi:hypothetical protein